MYERMHAKLDVVREHRLGLVESDDGDEMALSEPFVHNHNGAKVARSMWKDRGVVR